ncbi:MAG TPA: biotin carboxylase N-terminal domain-containing protein [Vicinamibacterales bacterium]|nr:biotin carboxylase N-terminal domain-containing protein [Vicinamibacterales bacterium]
MIRRVLIANRGEIARRVIRTARAMGIASVAIYSEPDAGAPHVREADAAEPVGPAPAAESYLNIGAVIEAARRSGADAIHPGYGFLSERPEFADACAAAGIIFVGPPASVIRAMGSKTAARATMIEAGVPVVPGETPADQSATAIATAARKVGFPVLLKAAAGGGGKGMRIVRGAGELDDAIAAARSEAQRSFGDGTLYVERLVERARHIEVQIFGDTHGNVVHVLERDCSLQRRHQKVIEEAPAPRLAPSVRARLLDAAVAAGKAVGYVSAGTIEFLLEGEGEDARFYFLEMNTRLQVEHPVTEAVTGLDLVRAQLLVASGEALPFKQTDVRASGHAIECRIYAEDARRLLPQSGKLLACREPEGDGIRVDAGIVQGQIVTVHYDPLLSKLIAHGSTRAEAIERMMAALGGYEILGLRHNISFLMALLRRPEVADARVHTRFIEAHLEELAAPPAADLLQAAAALAAWTAAREDAPSSVATDEDDLSARDPWSLIRAVRW